MILKHKKFPYLFLQTVLGVFFTIACLFSIQATASAAFTDMPTATPAGPITIDVWYGPNQQFGQPGLAQKWINILGNLTDTQSANLTLVASLNNGTPQTLSLGPDGRRLLAPGDFNVELDRSALVDGANTVVLTGTDDLGNSAVTTVTIQYSSGNVWPLPYQIDWATVSNVQDVIQVVDGLWNPSAAGIRTDASQVGYDRVIAVGDTGWTDYEVVVPVTIHGVDTSAYSSTTSVGPGLGVIMRWQGHTDSPVVCTQPHCGWEPQGASAWYEWLQNAPDVLQIFGSPGSGATQTTSRQFVIGHTYWFKVRAETLPAGTKYSLKVWEDGVEPEPTAWTLQRQTQSGNLATGSLLFVAHHVDATFGDVFVAPLYALSANATTGGSVAVNPVEASYALSQVVTLTATADTGWQFDGWTGDVSSLSNPLPLTVTGNTVVTATFSEVTTLQHLTITIAGQGSVTADPPGPDYPHGQVVTLTAQAGSGWVFDAWSGDVSGTNNPVTIIMDGPKKVNANFKKATNHTLSVATIDGGSVLLNPEQASYIYGEQVQLTAVPESGKEFLGWSGDLAGRSNPATLRMTGDKIVTATFGTADGTIVSDDFNACVLNTNTWTFVDPMGDSLQSMTGTDFVISVPAGVEHDIWINPDKSLAVHAPRIMQPTANTDFEVEVKFNSGLVEKYETQGILVQGDADDVLRFEILSRGPGTGTYIYAAHIVSGTTPTQLVDARIADTGVAPIYMKITRQGDQWRQAYSFDGSIWMSATTQTVPINVVAVGPYGGNSAGTPGMEPPHATLIDFFFNTAAPIVPEDPKTNMLDIVTVGSGSVSTDPAPPFTCGQRVSLTAIPDSGWVFDGWSGAVTTTTLTTSLTVSAQNVVTATFVPDMHFLYLPVVVN